LELQERAAELQATHDKLKASSIAESGARLELQARDAEVRSLKTKHHDALTDLEALRSMEHELKAQIRTLVERDEKLQSEVERLTADNAQAEADRQAGERAIRIARLDAESSSTVRSQVESSLQEARGKLGQMEEEIKRTRGDKDALQKELERARRQWEEGHGANQKEREAERAELQHSREKLKILGERMEAKETELQGVKGQLQSALADVEGARSHEREEIKKLLKVHADKEAAIRGDLAWAKDAAVKAESRLNASEKAARKARWEADTAAQEVKWLEGELKRLAQSTTQL
jgi:chromosome segregation ATPase